MTPEGLEIRAEITAEPLDLVDNDLAVPPGRPFVPHANIGPEWASEHSTPDPVLARRKSRARAARCPRIYLHIGEPKTGTTFLQDAMWDNRSWLSSRGVLLPGYGHQDHSRASRDLREAPRPASDPADPWAGEWDVLTRQALRGRQSAVISDELLAVCTARQADRAVRSLFPAEVHVVLTVRDFATLLPAEWQEKVKCRGTARWEEWLDRVIGTGSAGDRRHQAWFWNAHDTLAILDAWSQHIPPDQVHVITMPRSGPADLLWMRFASVLGIDPGGADLTRARANSSLGLLEAEFLRRMNAALPEELPDWFYTRNIKRILAHDVLSGRPRQARLALPAGREAWARGQAEQLVRGLRDSKYQVVGDLGELLPRPVTGRHAAGGPAGPDRRPATGRDAGPAAEQLLDTAVHAAAALAARHFQETHPAPAPRRRLGPPQQMARRLQWKVLNGPRMRRLLRSASHRPSVRRLRVVIWCVLTRPNATTHGPAPGRRETYRPARDAR
jgi:hypothetical protein